MTKPISAPSEKQIMELLKVVRPLPSERFYRRMQTTPWSRSMYPLVRIDSPIRRALALLTLILVVAGLLLTPQGHALAQQILQFFTPTKSETFQVSDDLLVSVTAMARSSPATRVPAISTVDPMGSVTYFEQIAKVEAQVGFDLKEFTGTPDGTAFARVTVFPDPGIVIIAYEMPGGSLVLKQGLGKFPQDGRWQLVPSDAVQSVVVEGSPGEYLQGYFMVLAGETEAAWRDDPMLQRLRWREGDHWFEIQESIYPGRQGYIDKDGMIRLAVSMVYSP